MPDLSWPRVFLFATQLLLLAGAMPDSAAAQPEEYRMTIQAAVQEYESEHWPEAQILFERAHEIYPSARALWGAGLAAFEQRDYSTALRYFREATDRVERPLLPDQRANAEDMIRRCMLFTARYALDVTPESATITVDDLPATVIDGELVVNPGRHEVVIAADGYESLTRTVNALPTTSHSLVIGLAPAPSANPRAAERISRTGWATLGAGVGLGVTAFITGGTARRLHSELQSECGGPCPESRGDDVDRGRRLARTSAALTVVGVASVGTGLALLVVDLLRDGPEEGEGDTSRTERPQLTPLLGREMVGADLRVSF